MKTNQLMKRDFNGQIITQRTKDSFFNATELLSVYNLNSNITKVFAEFWSNKKTKDFIQVLENDLNFNIGDSLCLKTHETKRGRGGATWMHPYLFVKFAMWLSPEFELEIIKWVHDNLIKVRNQSGNYYKEMCDCIQENYIELKGTKPNPLIFVSEARFLNSLVYGTCKGGKRNELSEIELELLNNLQKLNIKFILMGDKDRKQKLYEYSQNFKIINA